jgi:hypothetical protein
MKTNNQLNHYNLINDIEKLETMLIYILVFVLLTTTSLIFNFIFFEYINIFYYLFLYFILTISTILCLLKISRIQKIFSD